MSRRRILAVMVIFMMMGIPTASVIGAEELTGNIEVEVKDFIGIVSPSINLVNQSVTLEVNITIDDENATYIVEDNLLINLDIIDSTERETFILPRSMFYSVFMVRNPADVKIMPVLSYFKRLIPVRVFLNSVNLIDSMMDGQSDNISIPLKYEITNVSYLEGENITMYVVAMGFLPGNVGGMAGIPIVTYEKIELEMEYVEK